MSQISEKYKRSLISIENKMRDNFQNPFWWVKWGAVMVFVGRAWQHLRWDVPYRNIFWDERLMTPIVRSLGMTWQTYTHNLAVDAAITQFSHGLGVFDAVCALLIISGAWQYRWGKAVLWLGVLHVCFLAFVYCKEHFYHVGQLFEFALQVALPAAMLCWNWKHVNTFLKLACSLTFICHGLYAIGYYPVPGDFVDMMLNGFGGNEAQARSLLFGFGVLDMVAAVLIWLHGWPQKIGLWYLIVWGMLTTFARITAHYHPEIGFVTVFENWWFHALYRFAHWMGPVAVWLSAKDK